MDGRKTTKLERIISYLKQQNQEVVASHDRISPNGMWHIREVVISAYISISLLNFGLFCLLILTLKLEENQQWYFSKKKKEVKIHLKYTEKICAVYEEGSANDQRYQKWFAKFHTGDSSLNIASQLDKQVC